jgi:hypothetical protein
VFGGKAAPSGVTLLAPDSMNVRLTEAEIHAVSTASVPL